MHPSDIFPLVDSPNPQRWSRPWPDDVEAHVPSSFGRLHDLGKWLTACHDACPPRTLDATKLVLFAGDHGIDARGIATEETDQGVRLTRSIEAGEATLNVLAHQAGVPIRIVDTNLNHDVFGEERVSKSSGAIDVEDAMSEGDLHRALSIGQRVADQEIDQGANLIAVGSIGSAGPTVAAVIIGMLTQREPVEVAGPGDAGEDERWKRRVEVIRDAMFRARSSHRDPMELLRIVGSPDIAALAACIAQAAVRRTPVLLDGTVTAAAALLADELAPGSRDWLVASHASPEAIHAEVLEDLDLTPLLKLEITRGEGVGAATALPLLRMAADLAGCEETE